LRRRTGYPRHITGDDERRQIADLVLWGLTRRIFELTCSVILRALNRLSHGPRSSAARDVADEHLACRSKSWPVIAERESGLTSPGSG